MTGVQTCALPILQSQILVVIIMLIAAAVFVVAIFKRLNLSPVLGYLVAGAMIGDHGMKIVAYEQTTLLAELNCNKILLVKNKLKKKRPIILASKKD